jgi:catechol 2,3-dioxygenase-like lactoylglutathione lyase family enzyme
MSASLGINSEERRRVAPVKFAHAVMRTNRFNEMIDWYRTVLEAKIVFANEMLAFLTFDDEHHRIAIATFPGFIERPKNSTGVDHIAYTYANLGDLIATYERLKAAGILPYRTINHGPTTSMYYHDPDNNGVELFVDNFDAPEELQGFFKSGAFMKNPIGVLFDADEMARKYHEGVPEGELKRYDGSAPAAAPSFTRFVR